MVGTGKVATSLGSDPPRLNPQMSCAGMFVSEVILKFGFALMRWTKYTCGGYWLKNWKQSAPGTGRQLNWLRPSNGRLKLLGFGAVLGHICGGAPNCNPGSVSGRDGSTGGIGIGSTKTAAGCGLFPRSQPPWKRAPAPWVNPAFGMSTPAPVISPILIRSRRVQPAFTSSSLFFKAFWMSRRFAL